MSETETSEVQALPGDGLREGIVDDLRRHIGEALVDVVLRPNDDVWVRIATAAWKQAGEAMHAMGFEYFCYMSAIDWLPSPFGRGEDDPTEPAPERSTEVRPGVTGGETRFQLLVRLTDVRRHVGLTMKVDVPDDTLTIESWFGVYAGANWHEREIHEMFGISFAGHPDLRNMYLPTEFEGYPLRKDFPLLARMVKPWPGIVDVEPMPAEEAPPEESVAGDLAPENPVPDQADAGLGDAPDEGAAAEAAVAHSVEEAPDHQAAPDNDARTDSGSHQDLVADIPTDVESTEGGQQRPGAAAEVDGTRDATPAPPTVDEATTVREEPGDEIVVSADDLVDESEVRRAEGAAVTEDEAVPSGRPADDEGEGSTDD